jgi:lysophospholipase L1-like esterase
MEVFQYRQPLTRTRQALQKGKLTVGYIGGSITDARPRHNWPETVTAWFVEAFPQVQIYVENAAISATGSELAVFRAERDLISRGCDLVFVEFAVNDNGLPADFRMHTREGLIRKLLADGRRDVVLVYTFSQPMYEAMVKGEVPASIEDFEKLAQHYDLSSIWMGLHAFEDIRKGRMRWEEWLPDGLHPQHRGSYSYAESVMRFLNRELIESNRLEPVEPQPLNREPLDQAHWGDVYQLDFKNVAWEGPWSLQRWPHLVWIDQVLHTAAVGAKLTLSFHGRGVSLALDYGKRSGEFRYRLDKGEWQVQDQPHPDWSPDYGWFKIITLAQDLSIEQHILEIEVIHGDRANCKGTNFDLAFIGVIP